MSRERANLPKATIIAGHREALQKAFQSRDETGYAVALDAAMAALDSADQPGNGSVVVNFGMPGGLVQGKADGEILSPVPSGVPVPVSPNPLTMDALTTALDKAFAPISARMDAFDARLNSMTTDAKAEADKAEKEKKEADDKKGEMTKDAAGIAFDYMNTLAQAEILVPGIQRITLDAAATTQVTLDAMCAFRRQALTEAMKVPATKEIITTISGGADIAAMTCDAADALFRSAAGAVQVVNNARTRSGMIGARTTYPGSDRPKPKTNAEINAANRKAFGIVG